jgi:hypothetical protein
VLTDPILDIFGIHANAGGVYMAPLVRAGAVRAAGSNAGPGKPQERKTAPLGGSWAQLRWQGFWRWATHPECDVVCESKPRSPLLAMQSRLPPGVSLQGSASGGPAPGAEDARPCASDAKADVYIALREQVEGLRKFVGDTSHLGE